MSGRREQIMRLVSDVFGRDLARPMEWLSLLGLIGWLQFLLTRPQEFALPRYEAFAAMPPLAWAAIIAGISVTQLVAFRRTPHAQLIRFAAMAAATGIWTVIALSFWSSAGITPISARTNSVIAFAAFVTAVYLGLKRQD